MRLKRWNFECALLVTLGVMCTERQALAESSSSDKAAAEALFDRGVSLLRAKDYKEACEKLETSEKIDPAVGTLLYLGECYERLGRTASAWAVFREASSLAQAGGQADRAKTAIQRAERLEPDLAYLAVSVSPEAHTPGLTIRRGGETVKPDLLGVSIPTDPGSIRIEASAPGYATFTASVTLAARERRALAIPELEALPGAPKPPADANTTPTPTPPPKTVTTPSPQPERPRHRDPSVFAYVLGGVGVVGLGVGSYFGVRAIQRDRATTTCTGSQCYSQADVDASHDASRFARISDVAFAASGALLAGGLILYLTAPTRQESALVVAPSFARNGASLALQRAF